MKMKPSRVLKKLRNGEVVSCFNVHFDPQVTDHPFRRIFGPPRVMIWM